MPTGRADDDRPTLVALGILAFTTEAISHEAFGHGLAALAVGGHVVLLTSCNLDSTGHYSKWIPAAGGLANLIVGIAALAILRLRLSTTLRYLLLLIAAFNLFNAAGYPAYSGIANFGDWTAVTSGLTPHSLWRPLLVFIGVAGYYIAMLVLCTAILPFAHLDDAPVGSSPARARLRRLTLIPFLAALGLAALAAARNPSGLAALFNAGLPSAAAAFGLTQLAHLLHPSGNIPTAPPIPRSLPLISAATLVAALFIGLLGPGIRFH